MKAELATGRYLILMEGLHQADTVPEQRKSLGAKDPERCWINGLHI